MNNIPNPSDFPFADLMGLKPKDDKLTEEQKAGKAFLELVKHYGSPGKQED